MSEEPKKNTKMTVFKTDRHEDMAAICFVAFVVISVLIYMAYIIPNIHMKAPADGKVVEVLAQPDAQVKKGDALFSIDVKGKKEVKKYKAKTDGKILSISAKPGDAVKKGKTDMLVFEHVKGSLP
jgi:multidrug resistance efflux pump